MHIKMQRNVTRLTLFNACHLSHETCLLLAKGRGMLTQLSIAASSYHRVCCHRVLGAQAHALPGQP